MNKNVEQMDNKLFYAVVTKFKSNGEEKLILHEATIEKNGNINYGGGNTAIIEPSSVLRIDRE